MMWYNVWGNTRSCALDAHGNDRVGYSIWGRHFWNRKCRMITRWLQEFAVLKCEATANSVAGHATHEQ